MQRVCLISLANKSVIELLFPLTQGGVTNFENLCPDNLDLESLARRMFFLTPRKTKRLGEFKFRVKLEQFEKKDLVSCNAHSIKRDELLRCKRLLVGNKKRLIFMF